MTRKRTAAIAAILLGSFLLAAASAGGAQLRPGDIIVADIQAYGGDGGLILVHPETGRQRTLSTNNQPANSGKSEHLDDPYDVTVTPGGRVLAAEEYAPDSDGSIVSVNPENGKQSLVSSNEQAVNAGTSELLLDPWGVLFVPGHGVVVSDYNAFGGLGGLIGINPATGKQRVVSSNDLAVNSGTTELFDTTPRLAQARSGELAVANHGSDPGLVGVNPATGKQRILSANSQPVNSGSSELFVVPQAVDVGPDGTLFVTDTSAFAGGGVIGVDPRTGEQSKVSANDMPVNSASMAFESPQGIATDLSGDLVVVQPAAPLAFGGNPGSVLHVDSATGAVSVLSSNDVPANVDESELFAEPYGITVVPPRCASRYATAYGAADGQRLPGTAGGDVQAGLGGPDRLSGAGAGDRSCGGGGADTIRGGPGADVLDGGPGRDLCVGGPGRDRARGCERERSL